MDIVLCYNIHNVQLPELPLLFTKKKKMPYVYNSPLTFDIETTSYEGARDGNGDWAEEPRGELYHWQWCVGGIVILGRDFDELETFFNMLMDKYCNGVIVIYVHFLGFEWQFIQRLFTFSECEIFAIKSHHPLVVRYRNVEFRCSWKLSNMGLEKFVINQSGTDHITYKGNLDYSVLRTPDTRLKPKEVSYCVCDVLPLYEALNDLMAEYNDNLASIPLTSTSYVRREVRTAVMTDSKYRNLIKKLRPCPKVYQLLKMAAAGGDTHANRYAGGRIWDDCDSYDATSSYIYQLLCKQYPMTTFQYHKTIGSWKEFDIFINTKACLFRISVDNIELKKEQIDPTLQSYKCKTKGDVAYDNGRILSAKHLETTMTDIDYRAFAERYEYDRKSVKIADFCTASYGYLPKVLRDAIYAYFVRKCDLADERAKWPEDSPEWQNLDYLYFKSKNKLNGIFGMMYTDPIRDIIIEYGDYTWKELKLNINDLAGVASALDDYYNRWGVFLAYQWGVWTTAHARDHLRLLQTAAAQPDGGDVRIYWDTDSVKGYNINHDGIAKVNEDIKRICEEHGGYYETKRKKYYLGVFEREHHMKQFITLGAKKYACVYDNDKLSITISGVNKEKGVVELKTIDNFKAGFIFKDAAATKMYYNNDLEKPSVASLENTYKLSAAENYEEWEDILCNGLIL